MNSCIVPSISRLFSRGQYVCQQCDRAHADLLVRYRKLLGYPGFHCVATGAQFDHFDQCVEKSRSHIAGELKGALCEKNSTSRMIGWVVTCPGSRDRRIMTVICLQTCYFRTSRLNRHQRVCSLVIAVIPGNGSICRDIISYRCPGCIMLHWSRYTETEPVGFEFKMCAPGSTSDISSDRV